MTITENQARALSNLLHEMRPEWNPKSLMTLIHKHREKHEFIDLTTAAVAVAANPAKGPAIIFMDGPHWPDTQKLNDIPHEWKDLYAPGAKEQAARRLTPWDKAYHRPTTNDRVAQGLALVEKFGAMESHSTPAPSSEPPIQALEAKEQQQEDQRPQ